MQSSWFGPAGAAQPALCPSEPTHSPAGLVLTYSDFAPSLRVRVGSQLSGAPVAGLRAPMPGRYVAVRVGQL